MVHKRLLKIGILGFIVTIGIVMVNPGVTSALPQPPMNIMAAVNCPEGQVHPKDWNGKEDDASCCPGTGKPTAFQCLMNKYINPIVNLIAALVGVIVLGSIIAGGIQYSSAGGDPGKVAAAKQRIINALLSLAGFVFLYAFLQWVIPGGL